MSLPLFFLGQNLVVHFVTTPHPQFSHSFYTRRKKRQAAFTFLTQTAGVVAMKLQWPRCVEDALTLDGTLDRKDRRKREMFFAINFTSLVFMLVILSTLYHYDGLRRWFAITGVVTSLLTVVYILCKKKLTTPFVVGVCYVVALIVFCADLIARCNGDTYWAPLVLVLDMLLVMQVPTRYTAGLVCVVLVWLALMAAEDSFRFGIFDLPGLVPQDGEFGRRTHLEERSNCEKLPCAKPAATMTVGAVLVFVADFIATRGFARAIVKEQATMERTISTVQEIASLLAKYDVEGVARMLAARGSELPEEMYETLQTMEENLRKYKPYLPAALFEEMEMEEDGDRDQRSVLQRLCVEAPGLTSETATLAFTDIRSSTSIWEHAPDGMRAGLKIHNTVMREVMGMFGGYEVKTIGDAFMVAFTSTQDGVNFGLSVHELLRGASWPASLLEDVSICAEQGPLWGGLTVRIGVNSGPVTVEENALTGRTDYFGHTVNVAARLESACKPGAVAVPSNLYTAECMSCSAVVGDAEALDLKGVSGLTFICCVWPLSLAGRRQTPLKEPVALKQGTSLHKHDSSLSLKSSPVCDEAPSGFGDAWSIPFDATVGTVHLAGDEDCDHTSLRNLSVGLSTLTVVLDQNGGTLVTLLGSRVCVGWNLTRPAPAHMENAVRFAQRLLRTAVLSGAGLVTGAVRLGDVGARKQRFVTVMGQTVYRSWALCDTAREGKQCLYEPPLGTVLPAALKSSLKAEGKGRDGLYQVLPQREYGLFETKHDM